MAEHTDTATVTEGGERRRRLLTGLLAATALAAVAACQPPPTMPGGGGPGAAPSSSQEPTPTDTEDAGDDDDGDDDGGDDGGGGTGDSGTDAGLPDFSDAVFPTCGEVFEMPERVSDLVVEGGPTEALPAYGGGWMTTITNNHAELIQGHVAIAQLVIVDGEGRVVAAPDPDDPIFRGAEGPFWMGIAPGETLDAGIQMSASCETGDWLPAGDYEAYATITFVGDGDFGDMEQAQGGPWPLTVSDADGAQMPTIRPPGTVVADLGCGATWTDPALTTGYELELLDRVRSPRATDDDVEGYAQVSIGAPIHGLLFTQVLVLRDGVIVNHAPGSDVARVVSATAGASVLLEVGTDLLDCESSLSDPELLEPGSYEVVVLVVTVSDGDTHVLASTAPVALELT